MNPTLEPILFVLGAPRSGTTLLRVMLEGHPALFSPPEMVLAPFRTMAERKAAMEVRFWEKTGLRRTLMELEGVDVAEAKDLEASLEGLSIPEVYAWLQARLGGRMLVDKCPHLTGATEALAAIPTWAPGARFLWIVRHPASVTRSVQNMPMAEVILQGFSDQPGEFWRIGNQALEGFLETLPADRWLRIHYEDMVSQPRATMEAVCAFLGLPFDEAMTRPYDGDRMREGPSGARAIGDPNLVGYGQIRPELATKWLEGFDPRQVSAASKAYAAKLGYDLDSMPLPPVAKVDEALEALWGMGHGLLGQLSLPADLDAIEGRRFLLRMIAASVDTFIEQSDADHPAFHHAEGPSRKMFGDNPDADYLRAPIRTAEGQVYRVWGRVPSDATYVGVLLYGKGGRVGNRLTDAELGLDAYGNFELLIAKEPQEGRWLKADGDETAVMVRQYFVDRRSQASVEVHIARLGEVPAPRPLDGLAMAAGLERARRMVSVVFERTLGAWKMASTAALNRFLEMPADGLFPTPDNIYKICWYRFGQDQLFFVRGKLPAARYFSFTLYNVWLESLDYERRTVCLNHTQIQTDEDGNFELVLAAKDPGHPNWLDIAGHQAGYLVARALLAEDALPDFEIQVIYAREWGGRG